MFRDILASCHFVQCNPDEIIAHKLRDSMFAKPIYAAVTTISTTKHIRERRWGCGGSGALKTSYSR